MVTGPGTIKASARTSKDTPGKTSVGMRFSYSRCGASGDGDGPVAVRRGLAGLGLGRRAQVDDGCSVERGWVVADAEKIFGRGERQSQGRLEQEGPVLIG